MVYCVRRCRCLQASTSASGPRGHGLLPEAGDVPDPDGLVEAGGDDHVLAGVELGAHHVVVVPRQHADALPGLPVPDPNCLVVAGDKEFLVLIIARN